jgi:hypothetical protein
MTRESFPRRVYNYFQKHYLLSALAATLPGWFSIAIRLKGDALGLTSNNALTTFGEAWFWSLFGVAFTFSAAKFGADKYDSEAKIDGQFLYQKVMDGVNSVTRAKLQRFEGFIRDDKNRQPGSPFEQITQPKQQIDKILENIQITLSEVSGIARDEIGLSIVCKAGDATEWRWLSKINVENDLNLHALVGNPCSSARQIIDGKTSSLFYGDKSVAVDNKEYVRGPRDDSYSTLGSIIARDVSIRSETQTYLHAVLSISTHGKQLCEQGNLSTQKKICEFILPAFESRLRLEMCLYYIKHHIAALANAA